MKHWITACLVVIGIALGFVLGRATIERRVEGDDLPGGSIPGKSGRHLETGTVGRDGPRDRDGSGEQNPRMAIRRAARILELSPMAGMDYDALFDAYEAIRWMTPEEARLALEELKVTTGNSQVRMTLQSLLIGRWAKQDGRGAVEYAMEFEQPMQRVGAMMGGLMGWAKSDPEAAHAWYQENRETLSGGMLGTG